MTERRDIVIAGGGMVGISLALQLGALLPPGTRICLVEGYRLPQPVEGKPDYHPSFDARSTALSFSSRLIYERIGVWEGLQEWLCPIERIHVSSRGHFGSTLLQASDYGWPALGYVVENAWLGNALVQALYRQGRVEVRSPARVASATVSAGGFALQLEGEEASRLEAALLLVVDGAGSGLRGQLGLAITEKPYRQHALVANVVTAQPHGGCAFERFTDQGPLALLPLLPAVDGQQRSALVWTLPPEEAARLQQCAPERFLRTLQGRFGYRLGRLAQVGERHSYPLSLLKCSEQVRQGLVVMGNAAHALHPVAGQGFNLALRPAHRPGADHRIQRSPAVTFHAGRSRAGPRPGSRARGPRHRAPLQARVRAPRGGVGGHGRAVRWLTPGNSMLPSSAPASRGARWPRH
ncbi:MAG: FAD-dependent monooxygenase [Halioglobus sp.]